MKTIFRHERKKISGFNGQECCFINSSSIERNKMIEWIIENKTWLFSGLAVAIPLAIIGWIISRQRNKTVQKQKSGSWSVNIQAGRDVSIGERKDHE